MGLSKKIKGIIIFLILCFYLHSDFCLENIMLANELGDSLQNEMGLLIYGGSSQNNKIEKTLSNYSTESKMLSNNTIISIEDINVNLYQNEVCLLPEVILAKLSSGKMVSVEVDWDECIIDSTNVGGYSVFGTVKGYKKGVKCTVIIKPIEELINKLVEFPNGEYDKSEAQAIKNRLSQIYPGMLYRMIKSNIKVKLITTTITDLPEYSYLKGLVPRGWEGSGKTWDDVPGVSGNPVAIKVGFSERGKGHSSINLELHETAHVIDGCILNGISKAKTFTDAWTSEVNELFPQNAYFINYPDEYFAETFAMFYLDNNSKYELSLKAPETFKFFEDLEESFYIKL